MDFTDLYEFQTSSGIIVPTDSEVLSGIQTKFQEIFGSEIDLSAETPVGRLIEAMSVIVKTTIGVTAQSANQFNVNEATGIYLDAIAQIYDLKRIAATKTKITIKCYFSESSTGQLSVPAGTPIMCSANGAIFRIDSDVPYTDSVDETGNHYGVGTATAIETGPIVAPEGTVTSMQASQAGWIGVTNMSPTYVGTNIETDEEFRSRILKSRPIGIGFDTHLVSSLNRLDGVYSNCVLDNPTGASKLIKGVSIPAHSIFVGVDFIETDDLKNQIAGEIARAKPVGTGMVKDGVAGGTLVTLSVNDGYGNSAVQDVYFWQAQKTAITISLSYSYGNYTGTDIETDIKSVIASYIDTIGVGGTVSSSMISNWLINNLDIGVGNVLVQKSGSETPYDFSVEMDGYETPFTTKENIFLKALG